MVYSSSSAKCRVLLLCFVSRPDVLIPPPQIRGFLSRFDNVLPASLAFDKCTACSPIVSCEQTRPHLRRLHTVHSISLPLLFFLFTPTWTQSKTHKFSRKFESDPAGADSVPRKRPCFDLTGRSRVLSWEIPNARIS